MISFFPPFLLGFLALSFQIFLLREFSVHFYGNEITFGLLLACWLLWGGIGSISASKFKFNPAKLPLMYYVLALFFPLSLIGLRFSRLILKLLPGEITGIITILIFSLATTFLISTPLGMLFVFNTIYQQGNLTRVYLLESIGSSVAGLIVYFFLIPFFSNWQASALIASLTVLVIFLTFGGKKYFIVVGFILLWLILFALFDFPSQKIYWKPFNLIRSKDTPYGKLQVIKTEEQISLYNNSLPVYSYPDLATAEEAVHFALLQKPLAKSLLLVGGGAGGCLNEILKYPKVKVDYVEIDPEIIRLSLQYLPPAEQIVLKNSRVHIYYQDGRAYLNKSSKKYDIIILNLSEPATAQLNRFYTQEFFLKVKERLNPGGVFSFRVPSAENYISLELQNFLSSLYYSLGKVFPKVKVVPGNTNIFLASSQPISIDFKLLAQKIKALNLKTTYVSPFLLSSRLSPLRIEMLNQALNEGNKRLNLDFVPISYFYNSVLWSSHFKGLERNIFSFLAKVPNFWLLDFPLALFLICLVVLCLRPKKSQFLLTPLAVMGFTTIVFELSVIISFQTMFGYLYQRIALLLASFMIGLSAGAFWGTRRQKIIFPRLLLIQLGFILLLLTFYLLLGLHPPEFIFFLSLGIIGFLGGDLFIVSNHLFLEQKKNYGLGYGLDLLGSFLGALAASSFLIPLVGLPILLKYLFLVNSFCFLFLIVGLFRK